MIKSQFFWAPIFKTPMIGLQRGQNTELWKLQESHSYIAVLGVTVPFYAKSITVLFTCLFSVLSLFYFLKWHRAPWYLLHMAALPINKFFVTPINTFLFEENIFCFFCCSLCELFLRLLTSLFCHPISQKVQPEFQYFLSKINPLDKCFLWVGSSTL